MLSWLSFVFSVSIFISLFPMCISCLVHNPGRQQPYLILQYFDSFQVQNIMGSSHVLNDNFGIGNFNWGNYKWEAVKAGRNFGHRELERLNDLPRITQVSMHSFTKRFPLALLLGLSFLDIQDWPKISVWVANKASKPTMIVWLVGTGVHIKKGTLWSQSLNNSF